MPLYHFYRLVNNVDDRCYIGMTKRELRKRLCEHRHYITKRVCSSKQLVERYGAENVIIVLIHSLEFDTIEEAHREERRLIEEYHGRCVNLVIPVRTEEEDKEKSRVWRDANKERVVATRREYREANKETINTKQKEWYEANKGAINARRREAHAKKANTKPEPMVADHES
jgi:methyl coenzyme M reductase subunit C-like uncharacterized protein (methanogenesis marker protein 7)